ncbi:NUDIX domain-containing protein [Chelativorans sp. M5D2P16]|uniref:NUDIX domain-containing protein n=1 Tax=Chelativorans sp. M5D2P16 TaxID=3095678 RepID=UPI002ACAAB83|nr:NUDIX domain-containing protein [Chelativorans sp. M5D2P16]MDZ5697961.1 NUDIX domain-containing protein [Chelativorans sp. M5D2P16]
MRLRVRLFHLWFLLRRPMTLGARGVVFDAQRRAVLLVRHTYVAGWQLPGGGVEPGETLETALERELAEEGNIALTGAPVLQSIHFNRQASRRDHVAVYLVTAFRQTSTHVPDREIAEARFFTLDALPEETTAATRRRLAEIFEGAAVSPEW